MVLLWMVLAGGLAALGAWGSRRLPHYEAQRRSVPYREAVTVLLAVAATGLVVSQLSGTVSQLFVTLWSVVFALVAVIDIETHFIPDVIILPSTALALLASLIDPRLTWRASLFGALAGLVSFYLIALVARGGFGLGDVKLAAFVGAVTGLAPVFYALVVGMIAGGVGALLLLLTRRMGRRSFMPYGPYLCLGGWLGMVPTMLRFWGLPL